MDAGLWMTAGALSTAIAVQLGIAVARKGTVLGIAHLLLRTRAAQRRLVYRLPFAKDQLPHEVRGAAAVVLFDSVVTACVIHFGWIPFAAPTLLTTVMTTVLLFAWFEVWFYATHRLMHTRPFYRWHAYHHHARVTSPWTSLSFSLAERSVLMVGVVGFAAAIAPFVPIAAPGVMVYLMLNYVLNVLGHSNAEVFSTAFIRSPLGRLVFSPTYHAMHHARYKGHYGLFTTILDRCFGTAFEDYPLVHARAVAGEGMKSLGMRLTEESERTR